MAIKKLDLKKPDRDIKYINRITDKIFYSMGNLTYDFLIDLIIDYNFKRMYDNAVPHPFLKININPWKDFISQSREDKIFRFWQSANNFIITYINNKLIKGQDLKRKRELNELVVYLKNVNDSINVQTINRIEKVIRYAEIQKEIYIQSRKELSTKKIYHPHIIGQVA